MHEPKASNCPHCRGDLPMLERLRGSNFCCREHREAWLEEMDARIARRLGHKRPIRIVTPLAPPPDPAPVTSLVPDFSRQ